MRELTTRVEQITADHRDGMAHHGGPLDLVTAFARPIPALMICELLGVPYTEREQFQEHAVLLTSTAHTAQARFAAITALHVYLTDLVSAKRARPSDDLLSRITTTDLTHDELVNIAIVLLGAGLDTTANMLALGAFALLQHPANCRR